MSVFIRLRGNSYCPIPNGNVLLPRQGNFQHPGEEVREDSKYPSSIQNHTVFTPSLS